MNWLKKLASFGPSSSVSENNGWWIRGFGGRTHAGVSVSESTAINLPGVYACVSRIADSIGMLPFQVRQRTPEGNQRLPDHRVSILLRDRPNPYMAPFTYKQTLLGHACLWGNGYCEVEVNNRGEAIGLWPLLPDATRPRKLPDSGELSYWTCVDGRSFDIDPDRIIHLKALSHDGYMGYSPITLARQAVGMAAAMEQYGAKFFANDARSGGFIQHPLPLSPLAQKNLQESMEKQGGMDNAHRIKVLEEGAKFISTTVPQDDAQFLGSREFQLSEFARMWNVPLVMLQSNQGSTVWGTGIEALMIGFVTYTLGPWIKQLEEEFTAKLFTEQERKDGLYVKCVTNALLRGDMTARSAWYKAMREIGVLNANEVRELEDLNREDGLDEYLRPSNWVPVDAPAAGAADEAFRQALMDELKRA